MAFGGTVSTDTDTITAEVCIAPDVTPGLPDTGTVSQGIVETSLLMFLVSALLVLATFYIVRKNRETKSKTV